MILRDALWATPIIILAIECDCGVRFAWPSNVSTAQCPNCGKQELWHDVDPKGGIWSGPVMENGVLPSPEIERWKNDWDHLE